MLFKLRKYPTYELINKYLVDNRVHHGRMVYFTGMDGNEMKLSQQISDKIDIENFIFKLVSLQGKPIFSHQGKLSCPKPRGLLAQMLLLYNQLYSAENEIFLCEDIAYVHSLETSFYQSYLQEHQKYPLKIAFYLREK